MKILICEENINKAKVLKDLLNVYHFKLITLTNSNDFLRQVQNHKPSVIIINENFSHKPGESVMQKLKTDPATCKIPIICISDNLAAIRSKLDNLANDGLTAFMQEPYKIKHLRHYVDRWTTFRSLYVRQ